MIFLKKFIIFIKFVDTSKDYQFWNKILVQLLNSKILEKNIVIILKITIILNFYFSK